MNQSYEGFYGRFETPSKAVGSMLMGADSLVGDDFKVEFRKSVDAIMDYYKDYPDADTVAIEQENEEAGEITDPELALTVGEDGGLSYSGSPESVPAYEPPKRVVTRDIHVTVNNETVTLHGPVESQRPLHRHERERGHAGLHAAHTRG